MLCKLAVAKKGDEDVGTGTRERVFGDLGHGDAR